MNYLELCKQVVEDAGISGNFESTVDQTGEFQRVVNWVRRAVQAVEGKWFDWDFLYVDGVSNTTALVVDQQDYPAPSLLNIWDQNAFIREIDDSQLEYWMWTRVKNQTYWNEPGDPFAFTILPSKAIRFYGIPMQVENIQMPYWLKPTVLVNDNSRPLVPEQFHDVIVYKALQYYANYESAEEVKMQANEGYSEWMEQLESHSRPATQGSGNISTGQEIQVIAEGSGFYNEY